MLVVACVYHVDMYGCWKRLRRLPGLAIQVHDVKTKLAETGSLESCGRTQGHKKHFGAFCQ